MRFLYLKFFLIFNKNSYLTLKGFNKNKIYFFSKNLKKTNLENFIVLKKIFVFY